MDTRQENTLIKLALAALLSLTFTTGHHSTPTYKCRMEPSATIEGWEVIAYPAAGTVPYFVTHNNHGFAIPCPK